MLAERGLVEILHPDELDPAELRAVLDRLLARRASTAPVGDYGGARRAADVLAELAARAAGGPHHWMWAVRT
jgi:predicted glycosyltransferase